MDNVQSQIQMINTAGQEFTGSAVCSRGKQTSVRLARGFTGTLAQVRIIGKEQKSNAEKLRDELILLTLQNEIHLPHAPFIALLWFPKGNHMEVLRSSPTSNPADLAHVRGIPLNASQRRAALAMVSDHPCLMTIHGMICPSILLSINVETATRLLGPPGTGKTSTIVASAQIWTVRQAQTWIVAQSNVAVKNIAEKLARVAIPFKLIVSKEFYVEW